MGEVARGFYVTGLPLQTRLKLSSMARHLLFDHID